MNMMSDIWYNVKNFTIHAAKGISRSSKSVVRSIRYKFDQRSTNKKQRALIKALGEKVYELSSTGVELPSEAIEIVNKVNQLHEHTATAKEAYVAQKAAVADQIAADKAAWAQEKAAHAEEKAIRKAELEAQRQLIAERAAAAKAEAFAQAEKTAEVVEQASEQAQPKTPVIEIQEVSATQE